VLTTAKYTFIEDSSDLPLLLSEADKHTVVAIDTENSGGLDVLSPDVKLLLVQLCFGDKAYVIDARKADITIIRDIFETSRWVKIAQNALYDYKILRVLRGITLTSTFDTMLAEALLQAGRKKSGFSLGNLASEYLDITMDKTVVDTFSEHPYDAPFTKSQLRYAADDVLVLPKIMMRQKNCLKQYGLIPIAELEFVLVPTVAEMELAGMKLDVEMWRGSLEKTKRKLFLASTKIRNVLPDPPAPPPKPVRLKKDGTPYKECEPKPDPILNLDSPIQVAKACKSLGIDLETANKETGKGLTNVNTLQLAISNCQSDKHKEVLRNIIEYRGLKQVEKTFGENLIDHVKADGRIHSRFFQLGTDAGRFSSSTPNLQNIQKKGEEGRILRSCFVPEVGNKYVIADYSQLHLRIAAEISNDPVMLKAFSNPDGDIHKTTASLMFGIPIDKVTYEQRKAAKTINFGIIYGMGVKALAGRLDCKIERAAELFNYYTNTYSVLMEWLKKAASTAISRGYARTLKGRYRWFPPLDEKADDYKIKRSFYERVGKNHPILGTDADMIKTAMVLLRNPLSMYNAVIINCIHDEVVVETPDKYVVSVAKIVNNKMIIAGGKFLTKVPILVDVKIRDSWWKDDGVNDDENGQQLVMKLDV
jgi:DNA polymerase I-like protein with 3'-5' exonuclease and polymerase domains